MILLAFDSFKGCLSAYEACRAAADAIATVMPKEEVQCLPMSDGGEGLVACATRLLTLHPVTFDAHDPLMQPITATYAISDDGTAVMEMAATSGLTLIPPQHRDPLRATTYGVGEMLLHAYHHGAKRILMGIGGSATCDGGKGMIACLQDHNALKALRHDLPITVCCDVDNPLYGPRGAAYVFAPQKGATPAQVITLDRRLRDFARTTESLGLSPALAQRPGAGAAGGLGYGLAAYLDASLVSGIEALLTLADFDSYAQQATLIITGEGQSDRQTLMGKVASGVLHHAMPLGVPVHLLSGSVADTNALCAAGFASVRSINAGDTRSLTTLLRAEVATSNLANSVVRLLHDLQLTPHHV